jgi:hypothetical protein
LILVLTCGLTAPASRAIPAAQTKAAAAAVIQFEPIGRHIFIRVRINDSNPLWFIFDTGDKVAIVDLAKAKSLGLNLHGEVNVGGAGPGTLKGSLVRDATLKVIGAEGAPQPVVMAIPLDNIRSRFGHDVDGIIGADFIKQFVVEVDYPARVLRLHDKEKFEYSGSGEIIPTRLNSAGHPIIAARISVAGRAPLDGQFVVDLGSGGSLILNRPFVERESLLPSGKTIRAMGGGAGGRVTGRVGRIAELSIGRFRIDNPLTMFSQDRGGAFASSELQGNIGAQIMSKFKVLLDYSRGRMILEPNANFSGPISPALSGLRLIGEGQDYKTFRVEDMLEDSPASEAGLQIDDIVLSVNGRPAAELTLWRVNMILEEPGAHKLSVRRGDRTLQTTLTPRKLV